ncbi:hypothetical protein D3C81_1701320 [compost metagenome]
MVVVLAQPLRLVAAVGAQGVWVQGPFVAVALLHFQVRIEGTHHRLHRVAVLDVEHLRIGAEADEDGVILGLGIGRQYVDRMTGAGHPDSFAVLG